MVLPSSPPQDPYYNINYLVKQSLAQLQTLYTTLATQNFLVNRAADTTPSTQVTLTLVGSNSMYGNGYLIRGYQLGIAGDAFVIAIPTSNTLTLQYNYQVFPAIPVGAYLSFVPPLSSIITNITNCQFQNRQWLIAQLTGQTLKCSQIENEFAFPGQFKLSDYLGLAAQISTKPLYWSNFYGITNDYFPYEVNPAQSSISTTQTTAQFIGGPSSAITLLQSGWIKGNNVPSATTSSYTNCVGTAIINTVELHIGGQLIETLTGEYIQNYMDMTTELQNKPALSVLYGKDDYSAVTSPRTYLINLPFFFYRETGLALPLVSLYRQDVELYFTFNNFGSNYVINADYSQFVMYPTSNNIVIGGTVQGFDRTTLTLNGGQFTGNVYSDMELLVDLTNFGPDANTFTLIDSAHPITINGVAYSPSSTVTPATWNALIPTATSVQIWIRFSAAKTSFQGGSYSSPLLFVFPFLQPTNIQPYVVNNNNFINASVIGEYVYLTGPELNFFKNRRLTYLIGQVQLSRQRLPPGSTGGYFQTYFVNPVYMLQFFIRNDRTFDGNRVYPSQNIDLFDFSQNGLLSLGMTFNGEDAFTTEAVDNIYAGSLEVFDKRTAPAYSGNQPTSNIFMYSFSIHPEVLSNPSGHVNMSRIKQQVLEINLSPDNFYSKTLDIYALNYNILRIEHGLAGLLFNSSQ
jgi:Major capsid protein N-terminus/Large eukaryotic DNA virus major capsid protein